MSDYIAPAPARHLPEMLVATTIVAVFPLAASLGLRASGVITSGWLSVAFAIAVSLGASAAGGAYWRKHGASEVLFSELLLWGWIRRWRQERELANATKLLQLVNPSDEEALSVERREHLLRQLAGALEGQDVYLNGHSRRVARHAMMIARGMGLPSDEVARIRAAAAVHDVGKLLTPKSILNKPGRLTDAEFEVIKRHPVDGAEMVAALGDPELTSIVRHHHERLDGAGYPDGLAGEEIPIGARIIAVADTFDAITSARPYREAAPHQKAIDIMRKEAGAQLDPEAVRSFLAYYSGNRPTVVWALVTSSIRRVIAWLSGDPAAAATISASKVAVATAATAAIGVAAAATPVPHVHPVRPAPVASIQHVALRATTRTASARSPIHVPAPVSAPARTTAAHPSAPVRARAARTRRPGANASRHRRGSQPASHGHGHANPAASNPTSPASAGVPSTGSSSHSPSTSQTVSNSAAGGASSRPTSTNPAGHVNHASNTGNAARNGQTPHPSQSSHPAPAASSAPAHPAPPPLPAAASHAEAGTGTGQAPATTPAPNAGTAAPPSSTPRSASGNPGGAGSAAGSVSANASGSAVSAPNSAPASGDNGTGNGPGGAGNGNGNAQGHS